MVVKTIKAFKNLYVFPKMYVVQRESPKVYAPVCLTLNKNSFYKGLCSHRVRGMVSCVVDILREAAAQLDQTAN